MALGKGAKITIGVLAGTTVAATAAAVAVPIVIYKKAEEQLGNFVPMNESVSWDSIKDNNINLVAMGDSITSGKNGYLQDDYISYADVLANDLAFSGRLGNYKNFAKTGDTIHQQQMLLQNEKSLTTIKEADIITMSLGGNDLLGAIRMLHVPFSPHLDELLGNIQEPNEYRNMIMEAYDDYQTNRGLSGPTTSALYSQAFLELLQVTQRDEVAGKVSAQGQLIKYIPDLIKRNMMIFLHDLHLANKNARVIVTIPNFPLEGLFGDALDEPINKYWTEDWDGWRERDGEMAEGWDELSQSPRQLFNKFIEAIQEAVDRTGYAETISYYEGGKEYYDNLDKYLNIATENLANIDDEMLRKYESINKHLRELIVTSNPLLMNKTGGYENFDINSDAAYDILISEEIKNTSYQHGMAEKYQNELRDNQEIVNAIKNHDHSVASYEEIHKELTEAAEYEIEMINEFKALKESGHDYQYFLEKILIPNVADIHPSVRAHVIFGNSLWQHVASKIGIEDATSSLTFTHPWVNGRGTSVHFEDLDKIVYSNDEHDSSGYFLSGARVILDDQTIRFATERDLPDIEANNLENGYAVIVGTGADERVWQIRDYHWTELEHPDIFGYGQPSMPDIMRKLMSALGGSDSWEDGSDVISYNGGESRLANSLLQKALVVMNNLFDLRIDFSEEMNDLGIISLLTKIIARLQSTDDVVSEVPSFVVNEDADYTQILSTSEGGMDLTMIIDVLEQTDIPMMLISLLTGELNPQSVTGTTTPTGHIFDTVNTWINSLGVDTLRSLLTGMSLDLTKFEITFDDGELSDDEVTSLRETLSDYAERHGGSIDGDIQIDDPNLGIEASLLAKLQAKGIDTIETLQQSMSRTNIRQIVSRIMPIFTAMKDLLENNQDSDVAQYAYRYFTTSEVWGDADIDSDPIQNAQEVYENKNSVDFEYMNSFEKILEIIVRTTYVRTDIIPNGDHIPEDDQSAFGFAANTLLHQMREGMTWDEVVQTDEFTSLREEIINTIDILELIVEVIGL